VALLALAIAIAGAAYTNSRDETGWVNTFVETLSGRSGARLSDAWGVLPVGFAFGAGIVSAVNPCGFAMLPAYLGLYMGSSDGVMQRLPLVRRLGRALLVGALVSSGFVVLFGFAGAIIGAGARFVVDAIPWVGLIVGIGLVLAGAWLMRGKLYFAFAARAATRFGDPGRVSTRGYFAFGLSYGTASLSCTLPIFLAVVGSTLAVQGLGKAIGEFVLYGLGMGAVILMLTLAMALFKGAMVGARRRVLPYVQPISAAFMVVAGMYVVYYWLTIGGLWDKIA
jgi:cytochrome c-type biogenesis protein